MIASTPLSLLLLDLPDEVLITIVAYLEFNSLFDASLVCKHFNDLVEPFLYHSIEILDGEQASILSASLQANDRRAPWICSLMVSVKFGDDQGVHTLPPYISRMCNLQDLCLETPDCNSKSQEERVTWVSLQDRYERIFGSASAVVPESVGRLLPNLQTCTLHFVDGEKELHSMTRHPMIFLHPKLKSLTMSCASTDFPDRLLVDFQCDETLLKSTGLEHLHLEECDIFSPSLAILLGFPKALKSLEISEGIRYDGMFNTRSSRLHGNVSPGPFVEAIAENCAESLEHLSLSLGFTRPITQEIDYPGQHLNLTFFYAMKQLDLDIRTVLLIRPKSCDHATWRRLPPNLETLKVFGIPLGERPPFQARRRPWLPLDACIASEKAKHGVRALKTIIYSYEYYRTDDVIPRLSISDDEDSVDDISQVQVAQRRLMEKCREVQHIFKKASVRLEVEMIALPNGFIPPYLFVEDRPRIFKLWESAPK